MRTVLCTLALVLMCAHAARPQTGPSGVSTAAATAAATPAPTSESAASNPPAKADRPAPSAAAAAALAEKRRPVVVPRFQQAVVIDGHLNDEAWKTAVVLGGFLQTQPGDNVAPSRQTEVLLGQDDKFLYVAFRAADEPDKVRATVAKRDAIFDDDYVGLYLDTFNDKRRAYVIFFNPLGVQADGVMTEGRGEDYSIDLVLESKGVVAEGGYTVEAAIPFKSLRYETGKGKTWGVHFFRRIHRFNTELDSWMPLSRDSAGTLSQAGHLSGLGEVSTGRTLEFIPSLTLSETGRRVRSIPRAALAPGVLDPGRFSNEPLKFEPGLTAKFGLASNLTLDVALNPDFAQVEADQTVVTANQRFPIFFEEKRPFFLEGKEIFETRLNVLHTRAIIDPDVAVKLSGKRGRNTFGLLLASDNAPGNFTAEERLDPRNHPFVDRNASIGVLRVRRDFGKESSVGLIGTSYRFVNVSNELGGVDGRFRLDPQSFFDFQVVGTYSRRPVGAGPGPTAAAKGLGYSYQYDRTSRHFNFNLRGDGRSPSYRADVGFTQRVNTNSERLFVRYSSEPNPKAKLISWFVSNAIPLNFDWQGRMQNWNDEVRAGFNLPRQTSLSLIFNAGYERVFETEFGAGRTATSPGAFAGDDGERSTSKRTVGLFFSTRPTKTLSGALQVIRTTGAFDFDFGNGLRYPRVSPGALLDPRARRDPGPGDALLLLGSLVYQPTEKLRSSLDYTKSRQTRYDTGLTAFDVDIYSLRTTYQFTRFLFARGRLDVTTVPRRRIRGQYLLGWAPNPGTSFYVGYNDEQFHNELNPFTGQYEPGFRRSGRTFFVKMSYLIRRTF